MTLCYSKVVIPRKDIQDSSQHPFSPSLPSLSSKGSVLPPARKMLHCRRAFTKDTLKNALLLLFLVGAVLLLWPSSSSCVFSSSSLPSIGILTLCHICPFSLGSNSRAVLSRDVPRYARPASIRIIPCPRLARYFPIARHSREVPAVSTYFLLA